LTRLRDTAVAVRAAYGADKDGWEKFLRNTTRQ
jgi:hypothetical protein